MTPVYNLVVSFGGFPSGFRHQLHHRWESWILDQWCWWSNSESLGNGFWAFVSLGMFCSPKKNYLGGTKIFSLCMLCVFAMFWHYLQMNLNFHFDVGVSFFPQEIGGDRNLPKVKIPRNQWVISPAWGIWKVVCVYKKSCCTLSTLRSFSWKNLIIRKHLIRIESFLLFDKYSDL